jgi:hypothetical protein
LLDNLTYIIASLLKRGTLSGNASQITSCASLNVFVGLGRVKTRACSDAVERDSQGQMSLPSRAPATREFSSMRQ